MCGVLGLLAPDVSGETLMRLSGRLVHRGPDDAGVYVGEGVGLAARRLSIIDLAGGRQPLSNETGEVWITFNGEVFNAPALRQELGGLGHRFRTLTDTEVVVHAYEQWGEEAVARLRGMFAFGLWDAPRRRLLLARDRFGIKPLYYAQSGARFAFASEVRPLLDALPDLPRRLSVVNLARLFQWGFIPSPFTAVDGVVKLPAAHTLAVEDGRVRCRRYWQLMYPPDGEHLDVTAAEAAAEFVARLREAVAAWRLSDVPVGALLSGGVDSAALAALLTELSGPIHTFTLGFEAASHDEAAQARTTARHLGSRHHTLTFTAADFDRLPAVVRHLEEPQCSATSVPLYLLYRACRAADFKVILTGEGADELLGGYHWFDGDRRARPLLRLPRPLRAALAAAPLPMSAAARRVLAHGAPDPARRYALWQQVASPEQTRRLLTRPATAMTDDDLNGHADLLAGRHPLDQFLWLDAHTRLTDFINFEVDRMSMAHSVEARPPFLDHALWEFCARLPPDLKLSPHGNKRLLRDGLRDRLPASVLRQPKRGLAAPHAAWFRAARLPAWAEAALHADSLAQAGYFAPEEVRRLRAEHQAGRADHSRLLMGVLTSQLWHDQFST